jgi:hypothetical protein
MKHLFKQPLFYTTLLSLLALGLIIASYVLGWTTPTQNPPAGNVVLSQGALPAGSAGYVQFASSSTAFGADANFFWDNTNKRLGIGTTTPSEKLEVAGNIKLSGSSPTYKITNVAPPTASSDAATKGYVDAASAGLGVYKADGTTYLGALANYFGSTVDLCQGWGFWRASGGGLYILTAADCAPSGTLYYGNSTCTGTAYTNVSSLSTSICYYDGVVAACGMGASTGVGFSSESSRANGICSVLGTTITLYSMNAPRSPACGQGSYCVVK